jgi:hypothetical protein
MSVGPYGAYTNPMNDLERRMDGVDLGRGRNASVSEYNSKRRAHPYVEASLLTSSLNYQDRRINPRSHLHRPR